jgi:GNAT superfamily N-acetyltransferase
MGRRIVTAREQVEMLSPWRREAFIKEARYPQEWRGDAPYGYLPSGRARNRPPSVRSDPDDPDSEVIDPSEIRYEREGNSVSAYHPNGDHLGNYSWENGGYGEPPHIGIAMVDPQYQGQGVSGGIIDHIREHHEPDLVHSGYRGNGTLSYQGRAGALRDLGNTEEEHNDYFNTTPYNYGESQPAQFILRSPSGRKLPTKTVAQQRAHDELMQQFKEDQNHPNFTGRRSNGSYSNPDMVDEYGDRHEYGYDSNGDYVGISDGNKDSDGYSEDGYNSEGYNREGYNSDGVDRDGYDEDGFHGETGLNRDGKTRHGYTPGGGQPPEGTVPMTGMSSHWYENGLPKTPENEQMMDDAANIGYAPPMYAVRQPHQRSPHTGEYQVGNGDTLYSSLERARQVAYHPDDPSKDKDIVSVDDLNPDELHTDASGKTPEDFHYAPVSGWDDAEDTASTRAHVIQDPQRHQRVLSDLGHGWSKGSLPYTSQPSFEYTDQNGGRSGRMYQQTNGAWRTEHQPQFGPTKRGQYDNHRDAADAVWAGTRPGPSMEHQAMEVNNDHDATGGGDVDWKPHPNGQGLMARTPHGDLHVVQDSDTGRWNWHAGPHGSQPGDEGNMRSPLSAASPNYAAASGIQTITNRPFHGGLGDELGEGWVPHPTAAAAYTRRLPSGNHGFVAPTDDGTYSSGIQRDNSWGQPYGRPTAIRNSPNLEQAKAFIHHRDSPVPASDLGAGWNDEDLGPRYFPAYTHQSHPSGASANIAWGSNDGGWTPTVHYQGDMYPGPPHKTPQEAANWADSFRDSLG